MYPQTNPTELFRERHLALRREAPLQRRLARRLRKKVRSKGRPRGEPHVEGHSWLRMLWGTGPVA
jgi:hypothetical protein